MKNKIIFATSNEGKMKEIRMVLSDLDYQVLSLKEAGIEVDIVEDGNTFEENAIIKAKTIMEMTGELVLADDSGLEVDYMDKAPGVLSARFMGENESYDVKNKAILERLQGVKGNERSARFVCVVAVAFPDGTIETRRAAMEGVIAHEPKGENGFGYDPIFYLPEYQCTSAELSPDSKNAISHRGKALEEVKVLLASKENAKQGVYEKILNFFAAGKNLFGSNDESDHQDRVEKQYENEDSMKILVVSDTHGHNTNLKAVLDKVKPIDLLIHAGDLECPPKDIQDLACCQVEIVQGNNDTYHDLPKDSIFKIGKYRIWLIHGHYQAVYAGSKYIKKEAHKRKVDIVIYGHTHMPLLEQEEGITVLNPGSLSIPRQEGRVPSYAIMELDAQGIMHYTIRYFQRK